jgi:transposase
MAAMPKRFPEEFKRDVVAVARRRTGPLAEVAADFGVGETTMQRWLHQADVDDVVKDGPTTTERPIETF